MKQKIQQSLQQLIGYKFTRTRRTGAIECLHFSIEKQTGEFGIHLQCPWRITKDNAILVGYNDLTEQPDETAEFDDNFDWDEQMGNLRDVKMANFLNSGKYIVELVEADNLGGFKLAFNDNIELTVFPTMSSKNIYGRYWRLLDNTANDSKHFVVSSHGIDEDK